MLFGTSRHNSVGSFAVVALMTRLVIDEYSLNPAQNGTALDSFPEDIRSHIPYHAEVVASTLAFTVGILHVSLKICRSY